MMYEVLLENYLYICSKYFFVNTFILKSMFINIEISIITSTVFSKNMTKTALTTLKKGRRGARTHTYTGPAVAVISDPCDHPHRPSISCPVLPWSSLAFLCLSWTWLRPFVCAAAAAPVALACHSAYCSGSVCLRLYHMSPSQAHTCDPSLTERERERMQRCLFSFIAM